MHLDHTVNDNSADPRCFKKYVYKCDMCGNKEIIKHVPNFDTDRLRKCPNCGVTVDKDNNEYLNNKKNSISQQIESLTQELNKITEELEQSTLKNNN